MHSFCGFVGQINLSEKTRIWTLVARSAVHEAISIFALILHVSSTICLPKRNSELGQNILYRPDLEAVLPPPVGRRYKGRQGFSCPVGEDDHPHRDGNSR